MLETLEVRFWPKVAVKGDNECWIWNGALSSAGYGLIHLAAKRPALAHRVAYELMNGDIPANLSLDHLCRNRACVNPNHLEPVPFKVNILRGISFSAQNARKTHCKNGHLLSGDNLNTWYLSNRGIRNCKLCYRIQHSKLYHAKQESRIRLVKPIISRREYECENCKKIIPIGAPYFRHYLSDGLSLRAHSVACLNELFHARARMTHLIAQEEET